MVVSLRREHGKVQTQPPNGRGSPADACRRGSTLGIDAFVVAVADLAGGGLVAVDVEDLEMLANHAKDVRIVSIQP